MTRDRERSEPVQLRLRLDGFDGPLDLLLALIEQHKLPIARVSLAQVADQYLAQVRALPSLDPDLLADFLAIASRLLLLKSRALLLTEEPDPVVEETAADLERRLAEYRLFRSAAEHLQALEARGQRAYATTREPLVSDRPAPLAPISLEQLASAWRRVSQPAPPAPAELTVLARASVDAVRGLILDLLRVRPRVSFAEVAGSSVDEVVAAFLAVLELFRRGLLQVDQERPFAPLYLTPASAPGERPVVHRAPPPAEPAPRRR